MQYMPAPSQGQTRIAIDQAIIDRIDEIRPHYMDRTTFINFQLDSVTTLGARPAGAGSLYKDLNKEEEETRAREELINRPPSPAPKAPKDPWSVKKVSPALVPDDLTQVAEKFVEWWAVRNKGAVRTESVAYRELNKLRAWKATDRAKALDKAIASGWKQLYEPQELKSFNTPQEAPSNHPAQKVFKASDLGPEWERANWPPSATGGKGVLEPGAF